MSVQTYSRHCVLMTVKLLFALASVECFLCHNKSRFYFNRHVTKRCGIECSTLSIFYKTFDVVRYTLGSIFWANKLRSATHGDLLVPRTRTVTYGPRSFAVSGPTIWNTLPSTLRVSATILGQFHSGLKTILFRLAYGT